MSTNSDYNWDGTAEQATVFILNHNKGDSVAVNDLRIVIRNEDGAAIGTFTRDSFSDTVNSVRMSVQYNDGTATDKIFSVGDILTIEDTQGDGNLDSGIYTIQVTHIPSDSTIAERTFNT